MTLDRRLPRALFVGLFGTTLGFTLSRVGFTDYDTVNAMFTLKDPSLILVFGGAVGLTSLGLFVTRAHRNVPPRRMHQGTIVGALLFGTGWALTGACPGVMFAQLGEGQLPAAFSFLGAVGGTLLYRVMHRRYFRWDRHRCS